MREAGQRQLCAINGALLVKLLEAQLTVEGLRAVSGRTNGEFVILRKRLPAIMRDDDAQDLRIDSHRKTNCTHGRLAQCDIQKFLADAK